MQCSIWFNKKSQKRQTTGFGPLCHILLAMFHLKNLLFFIMFKFKLLKFFMFGFFPREISLVQRDFFLSGNCLRGKCLFPGQVHTWSGVQFKTSYWNNGMEGLIWEWISISFGLNLLSNELSTLCSVVQLQWDLNQGVHWYVFVYVLIDFRLGNECRKDCRPHERLSA